MLLVRAPRELAFLLATMGLGFSSWFVAELSNGFFADQFFLVSLAMALGLALLTFHLWMTLQRERNLRQRAEALLDIPAPPQTPAPRLDARPRRTMRHDAGLTPREREVLVLIAGGRSNQEIGSALQISLNTVESHSRNIYQKLGVRSRVGATAYAYEQGLLSGPPGL